MVFRTLRSVSFVAGLSTLVLLSGCGDDNPTSPNTELTQAQAQSIAQQVAASFATGGVAKTELDQSASVAVGNGTTTAPGMGVSPDVDEMQVGDLTFEFSYQFFNEAGDELSGWDSSAVRLVVTTRAYGSFAESYSEINLGHAATHDITGLEMSNPILTFNGSALDTLEIDPVDPQTADFNYLDYIATMTFDDVTAYKDSTVNPYPLSGTATWMAEAEGSFKHEGNDVVVEYEAMATIVFNGTAHPDIVVDGRYRFRADLVTGTVMAI